MSENIRIDVPKDKSVGEGVWTTIISPHRCWLDWAMALAVTSRKGWNDETPGFGAFWGEVNSNVHKGLGCLGCVVRYGRYTCHVMAIRFCSLC